MDGLHRAEARLAAIPWRRLHVPEPLQVLRDVPLDVTVEAAQGASRYPFVAIGAAARTFDRQLRAGVCVVHFVVV